MIASRIVTMCALVTAILTACEQTFAAGPVLYQDCTIAWNANAEPDLAGYRVYVGRVPGALTQTSDLGYSTQVPCSGVGVTTNGQWYVSVSAYDTSGNESSRVPELPFQLTALISSPTLAQVSQPAAVQLTVREPGFQLYWTDTNLHKTSHRIEVASSAHMDWATLTVLPPGSSRLSYFHPVDVEWVCYRLRAESGLLVSLWAQAGGPDDRQFCFAPTRVPSIAQPIPLPSLILEPRSVQLTPLQPGFQMNWQNWAGASFQVRIEVSSSIIPSWTSLGILGSGSVGYGFLNPIDVEWVCFRMRYENNQFVSLWAVAGLPNDRQFCFSPLS